MEEEFAQIVSSLDEKDEEESEEQKEEERISYPCPPSNESNVTSLTFSVVMIVIKRQWSRANDATSPLIISMISC